VLKSYTGKFPKFVKKKKQIIIDNMEDTKVLAQDLIDFIDESPSPYHVIENAKELLDKNDFEHLCTGEKWDIKKGGKYYVTKNDSAVFAFVPGTGAIEEDGFKIVSAHTDSPTFRIKPKAEMTVEGKYLKLNTEVYGGPILYTWFDRPLSLAGRVFLKSDNILKPECRLIKFDRPILFIPHLAYHFNRAVNDKGNPLSKQKDMLPVVQTINDKFEKDNFLVELIAKELGVDSKQIADFDLTLFEFEKGCIMGLNEEFISSGKLDDLAMAYGGLRALLSSKECKATKVLALFDNEECGSGTKQGAGSPVLKNILVRQNLAQGGSHEDYFRALEHSFMISADMAHALHPNYAEKHDPTNHPHMNAGPVIKIHANQKYITDGQSESVFEMICEKAGVPCQKYVNDSDMLGGSTLGNILLAQMDIKGVDIGNPMWGMHSVRETGGVDDQTYVTKAFETFYNL
jgi:aspartyl aminopeptidase